MRDAKIADDAALLQETREIASILKASLKTARKNTVQLKDLPRT